MKKQCKYFSINSYTGVFIKPRIVTMRINLGQLRHRSVAKSHPDVINLSLQTYKI